MYIDLGDLQATDRIMGEVARNLKLPRWKITRHAVLQGWIARTKKEPDWTERELGILERSAHLSPERIALRLKARGYRRSATGVVLKRKRMRFLHNLHGQSKRQVAQCFGVDDHAISRWIRLGYLVAKRRGTKRVEAQGGDHWFIKDRWIKEFIVNNVAEIDFRKVDKFWLVDLLAGGPTAGDARGKQINTKGTGRSGWSSATMTTCAIELERVQRTIRVLVAAGLVSEEKVKGAYEIAGWK